jgi:hypothetical protein
MNTALQQNVVLLSAFGWAAYQPLRIALARIAIMCKCSSYSTAAYNAEFGGWRVLFRVASLNGHMLAMMRLW